MKRFLLFLAVIATLAAACGGSPAPTATEPTVGTVEEADNEAAKEKTASDTKEETTSDSWPILVANQVDGSAFDAGDYANQDVILWFWAPW